MKIVCFIIFYRFLLIFFFHLDKPTKLIALEMEKDASGLSLDFDLIDGESNSRNSSRPVSLDLSTPSSGRKQKFQFLSPPFGDDDDDDDASVIAGLSPPNEYPGKINSVAFTSGN
jgi:hypothetical protein